MWHKKASTYYKISIQIPSNNFFYFNLFRLFHFINIESMNKSLIPELWFYFNDISPKKVKLMNNVKIIKIWYFQRAVAKKKCATIWFVLYELYLFVQSYKLKNQVNKWSLILEMFGFWEMYIHKCKTDTLRWYIHKTNAFYPVFGKVLEKQI